MSAEGEGNKKNSHIPRSKCHQIQIEVCRETALHGKTNPFPLRMGLAEAASQWKDEEFRCQQRTVFEFFLTFKKKSEKP